MALGREALTRYNRGLSDLRARGTCKRWKQGEREGACVRGSRGRLVSTEAPDRERVLRRLGSSGIVFYWANILHLCLLSYSLCLLPSCCCLLLLL